MIETAPMPAEELQRLRDKVIDLWSDGVDAWEIAEEIGFAKAWVDREIDKHTCRQIRAGKPVERRA